MDKKNIKIISLRDYISYQEYLHLKENNLTDYYLDSYFQKGGMNFGAFAKNHPLVQEVATAANEPDVTKQVEATAKNASSEDAAPVDSSGDAAKKASIAKRLSQSTSEAGKIAGKAGESIKKSAIGAANMGSKSAIGAANMGSKIAIGAANMGSKIASDAANMGSKIASDAANSANKYIEKKREHQKEMAKIASDSKVKQEEAKAKSGQSGGPVAINIGNQGGPKESKYEDLLKEQDKAKIAGIENLDKCQDLFIDKVIEGVTTYVNLRSPYKNVVNPVLKEELKEALEKKIDRLVRSGGVGDARSAIELNTKMLKICEYSPNDILNQFDSFLNENKNFKSVVREINLSNNKLSSVKRVKQELKELLKIK